ncbi:MAG: Gldg family protein [Desmonostoc vinosum HA7617-LM4]|jgi:ABC-type uncharacterized transport system involved in gliding motility auxiliary subunit|nr:Gldg family protein [Desmonostoc vinosum HA7617-LM4]
MKKFVKKKLWIFIFWLGPFLFVTGLTAGLVADNWIPIPLGLLVAGIIVSGLWLVSHSRQNDWWASRSTQAGTNALVATLAVLAILGLINFLGTRYHLRIDFTESQWFTLAPESRELIGSIKQPVKVWVFDVTQNSSDRELLEIYQQQNPNFEFEYIDPRTRPGLADKFGVQKFGEVYLESQNRRQLVQTVNKQERLSEVKLTNRLLQITTFSTAKVYFLQGHGERVLKPSEGGISQAVAALSERKYTVEPLELAKQPSVPQDANVVVIIAPKRTLFENEIKALQAYMNQGGNLLLMVDPNTDPKLDSFLSAWGVKLDNRLVIERSGELVGRGPAEPIVTQYGQHPITKVFGNGFSVYGWTRPIEIKPVSGIEATPLLLTKPYPESWAEGDLKSEKLEFNPDKDLKGPLTLGVALQKKVTSTSNPSPTASPSPLPSLPANISPTSPSPSPSPPSQKPQPIATESRLVVLGNSDFMTDGWFQQQLNGDVFLNSVTWLSQQDQQLLSISPKEQKNRRLNLTLTQAYSLLSLLLVLPLSGLVMGAIIWWQRR